MEGSLKGVALVVTGLHAGFSLGHLLSTHPAMMRLEDKAALKLFAEFYGPAKKAQMLQLITIMLASGTALAACPLTSRVRTGHIASLLDAVFVTAWTMTQMYKDNDEMVELGSKGQTSPKARTMLQTWGMRHSVRTVVASTTFCYLAYAFLKRSG